MKSLNEFIIEVAKYKLEAANVSDLKINFKYANGCGAKGGIKVPKTMWGLNIESACIGHDIDWQMSKNFDDLLKGNRRFSRNLKRIIDSNSGFIMKRLRRWRAAKYVTEIELIGTKMYDKERGFDRRE